MRLLVERTLDRLANDPFQQTLRSHKLRGELDGVWSCTIEYDLRLLFEFVVNPDTGEEEIHLLALGTHDEVY